jgi:hypothetical protein
MQIASAQSKLFNAEVNAVDAAKTNAPLTNARARSLRIRTAKEAVMTIGGAKV